MYDFNINACVLKIFRNLRVLNNYDAKSCVSKISEYSRMNFGRFTYTHTSHTNHFKIIVICNDLCASMYNLQIKRSFLRASA